MNLKNYLTFKNPQRLRDFCIKNFINAVYFDKMIPCAHCSELAFASLLRPKGNTFRVSVAQNTAGFRMICVGFGSVTIFYSP